MRKLHEKLVKATCKRDKIQAEVDKAKDTSQKMSKLFEVFKGPKLEADSLLNELS